MISKEQFLEWKEQPVTKEIYKELEKLKQDLLISFSEGITLGHRADITHALTHEMIGQIRGINQLLNASYNEDKNK